MFSRLPPQKTFINNVVAQIIKNDRHTFLKIMTCFLTLLFKSYKSGKSKQSSNIFTMASPGGGPVRNLHFRVHFIKRNDSSFKIEISEDKIFLADVGCLSILKGDFLTNVNNRDVRTLPKATIENYINQKKEGDEIWLDLLRNYDMKYRDSTEEVSIKLAFGLK